MEFYNKYINEVEEVFEQCKARITNFPEQYINSGLEYIDKFNPIKARRGNYICYMMPFWLKDPFQIDENITKQISMANVFKMLYFFIQDDIIDSSEPEKYSQLLPLANLFFVEFYEIYQRLFPSDSSFWLYFKRYFQDWAVSIDFEKNTDKSKDINLSMEDMSILAKKAAPLKLSACAACLLSDNEEYIDNLDKYIDYVLITLQLIDDWIDKYKDFEEKSFTPVLGEIMKFSNTDNFDMLQKVNINKAAYFSDIPEKIYTIAKEHRIKILNLSTKKIPDLTSFHEALINTIEEIIEKINIQKKDILKGGFYNCL